MERRSFWPKSLADWTKLLAVASLLLGFVFGVRMFFVTGAVISIGFLTAGLSGTVADFRSGRFRKHPLLMSFNLAWQAGPILFAAALAYVTITGVFGKPEIGPTVGRLIAVGLYLFIAMVGVFSLVFACLVGRSEPHLIGKFAREGKYGLLASHVIILALCAAIPAIIGFAAWWLLSGR